jgi:hypothetical protein
MRCLTDAEIQAVVDREAPEDVRTHAETCVRCRDRVRERETLANALAQIINMSASVPPAVRRRVQLALSNLSSAGATRLRAGADPGGSRRRALWSMAAVAAATVIAVVFVAPMVKGPATVSAAEILARSANRLAERVTSGVELLEYELTLDGVTREMMPDHQNGSYRVKQVIDHDTAGRYFVATYDPDGRILSSIAQDPAAGRRVVSARLEDVPYRFEFTLPKGVTLSPPEMERLHMQASVALMQASGNQQLQIVESPAGRRYRIEVPQVSGETSGAFWDLTEARVVIDASDYHIVEFAVSGTFLKQPYSVSYRLINRTVTAGAAEPGLFDAPEDPGAITITGKGTVLPARDVLVAALEELARVAPRGDPRGPQ